MSSWLTPAIISLAIYGLWGYFPAAAGGHINRKAFILFNVLGSMVVTGFIFLVRRGGLNYNAKGAILAFFTGVAGVAGTYFLYKALNAADGKKSVVMMLTALYPLIAIVLAWLFLKQSITPRQLIGMVMALGSLVLMAG